MRVSTCLYTNRPMSEGHPELNTEHLIGETSKMLEARGEIARVQKQVTYIKRLVGLGNRANVLVLGCGPQPQIIKILTEMNFDVTGVEPVSRWLQSARESVGDPDRVLHGSAERIPLPAESQDVVFFESVLEHVDSAIDALRGIFRVLRPNGVALISTTNRHDLRPNAEYRVPLYQWLPAAVKEGYVHAHLHFRPELANYTPCPAVHWFSYVDLCRLGREAGFSRFYSLLDVVRPDDASIAGSWFRRRVLPMVQRSPWLRAVALAIIGGTIFMVKRPGIDSD